MDQTNTPPTSPEKKPAPSIRAMKGLDVHGEAATFYVPDDCPTGRCADCGRGYRMRDIHGKCKRPELGWLRALRQPSKNQPRRKRQVKATTGGLSIIWLSDLPGQERFPSPADSIAGVAWRGFTPLDPDYPLTIQEELEDEAYIDNTLMEEYGAASVREDTPTEIDGSSPRPEYNYNAPTPPWQDFMPSFTPEHSPTTYLPRDDSIPEIQHVIKQEDLEGDTLAGFYTTAEGLYSHSSLDRPRYPSFEGFPAPIGMDYSPSPWARASSVVTMPMRLPSEPLDSRGVAASERFLSVPWDSRRATALDTSMTFDI